MVLLNVTSLYMNITIIDTLNLIKDYVNNDDQITRATAIPQDNFLELGGDYMFAIGRDEIMSCILHKLYLAISCKRFHPGKEGSFFCTAVMPLCRDKISPYNRFSQPKQDERVNQHISLKNFNRS